MVRQQNKRRSLSLEGGAAGLLRLFHSIVITSMKKDERCKKFLKTTQKSELENFSNNWKLDFLPKKAVLGRRDSSFSAECYREESDWFWKKLYTDFNFCQSSEFQSLKKSNKIESDNFLQRECFWLKPS